MSKRTRNRIIIGSAIIILVVIASVVIMTLPGVARNINLTAALSEIAGIVEVRNSAQENYNPVTDGYVLKMVQQLQTQQKSKVRLDLSTGSIVRLGQATIFSLAQPQDNRNGNLSLLSLTLGRIWIVLKGGSIDVETPKGLASVRGSYMSVWVDNDANTVTMMCLEGHCSFKNNAGIVELTSAQKIIITDPNILPIVQPMDMSDIQSWLDNCPESADIIPSILLLVATSTPMLTAEGSPTGTTTPTATQTPTPTLIGGPFGQTATYSYLLTATAIFGTGTATPAGTVTLTPTWTATLTVVYPGTNTPTWTQPPSQPSPSRRATSTATQPAPPPATATRTSPPPPTATRTAPPPPPTATRTPPPPPPPTATPPPPPTSTPPPYP